MMLISPMDNTEDQVFINRVVNGDPGSFEVLVDRYKYMAYTIALKILRNEEDAQDVAQESFVKAYQQLHQFKGRSKFSTWLYTIVYRTAVSRHGENRIQTLSLHGDFDENHAREPSLAPFEQLQLKEEQRYVTEAIQRLPETESLLVTLFYINENTIREIQEITGLSLANIKIKLFRARKRLERELKFLFNNDQLGKRNAG